MQKGLLRNVLVFMCGVTVVYLLAGMRATKSTRSESSPAPNNGGGAAAYGQEGDVPIGDVEVLPCPDASAESGRDSGEGPGGNGGEGGGSSAEPPGGDAVSDSPASPNTGSQPTKSTGEQDEESPTKEGEQESVPDNSNTDGVEENGNDGDGDDDNNEGGDGVECGDKNCHPTLGVCVDLADFEPECSCRHGYVSNGIDVCNDVDECAEHVHNCYTPPDSWWNKKPPKPAHCVNTEGSFTCGECPDGLTGDGVDCTRDFSATTAALDADKEWLNPITADLARERAVDNELIIIFGDSNYCDVILNLLVSLHRLDIYNYVVYGLDSGVAGKLEGLYVPVVDVSPHFKRRGVASIFTFRMGIIRNIMALGLNVFHLDADVVWRKNVYDYIDTEDFQYEALSATFPSDAYKHFGKGTANGGFFHFVSTPETIAFMDRAIAVNDETNDDQKAFNYALWELGAKFESVIPCMGIASKNGKDGKCMLSNNTAINIRLMDHRLFVTAPRMQDREKAKVMPVAIHACATQKNAGSKQTFLGNQNVWRLTKQWESCGKKDLPMAEAHACLDSGAEYQKDYARRLLPGELSDCYEAPIVVAGSPGSNSPVVVDMLEEYYWMDNDHTEARSPRSFKPVADVLDKALADPESVKAELDAFTQKYLKTWAKSDWCNWGWHASEALYMGPALAFAFPRIKFVHIIRDVRETVASKHADDHAAAVLGPDYDMSLPAQVIAAIMWQTGNYGLQEWVRANLEESQYFQIKVEDLCANPTEVVGNLAAFLHTADELPDRRGTFSVENMIKAVSASGKLEDALAELAQECSAPISGEGLDEATLRKIEEVARDGIRHWGYPAKVDVEKFQKATDTGADGGDSDADTNEQPQADTPAVAPAADTPAAAEPEVVGNNGGGDGGDGGDGEPVGEPVGQEGEQAGEGEGVDAGAGSNVGGGVEEARVAPGDVAGGQAVQERQVEHPQDGGV